MLNQSVMDKLGLKSSFHSRKHSEDVYKHVSKAETKYCFFTRTRTRRVVHDSVRKLDSNSCFKRNNEYSESTRKLDANKSKKVLKALRTQFETHERTRRDEHKQFKELEHATRRLIIE
jgi:hypothetical protein